MSAQTTLRKHPRRPGACAYMNLQNILLWSRAAWHLSVGCSALRRDPYVTGTSVLGIVYKDGVMLAADTLGEGV